MRSIKLKAIKKCPGANPGEEFMANSVEAKALVALGLAKRLGSPAYSQSTPVAESPAQNAPVLAVASPEGAVQPSPTEPLISKAVRELAESAGLDISTITGTGKDGRITRVDVEAALAAKKD